MRALVVGCGYVGLALGAELARQGHEVWGVRRSADGEGEGAMREAGIRPLVADITRLEDLRRLPGSFDWVVNCVSSSKGGVEEYRQVYLQGTRNLIEWLASTPERPKKFVYTSSTSVYGQVDGSWVDESSPTEPGTETGRVLVETERVLVEAAREGVLPAVVLRVAGIYGPGRGHLFQQYVRNEAKIPGRGERMINMIHRDDLVTAIIAALNKGRPGEVYNVADDEPVALIDYFRWLAERLGGSMPPVVAEELTGRKRGLTNKRVKNHKLRLELDWRPAYADYRLGYAAEIQRLGLTVKLDKTISSG